MPSPVPEPVDDLPFSSPERRRRYDTARYRGAVGRNWYDADPTLQFLMGMHLDERQLAWATPHLRRVGALMGGPIATRAEETDRHPPTLERYDRWGHEIGQVVLPHSFEASRADLLGDNLTSPAFAEQARAAGVDPAPLAAAWTYLLDQAEIGMMCALGTGGDMVVRMAEAYAPEDVRQRVRELFGSGDLSGEAAQMFTERTGGSDLGALETTATPTGEDTWRLDGLKWFVSNVHGSAFVALAKIAGGADGVGGVAPFLVLAERRDGSRNGIRIRRLKDKLGTRAVPSGEVELVGAEAFLLAPGAVRRDGTGASEAGTGDMAGTGGPELRGGLARMMRLTNGARVAIAMMGVGCARRALVEALCYAQARDAFGAALVDQPLAQRKLAELIVEVEAAQAMVFDATVGARLRLAAPLAKLRAARLGITAASDAIELHGGNGYIENWPVARILRDAQVNTVWEGPDNILCLDVRRAIVRDDAHLELFARAADAVDRAPADLPDQRAARQAVADQLDRARRAVDRWRTLPEPLAEARLFPLAQVLVDLYAGAALLDQVTHEATGSGADRKALVAALYARRHLAPPDPLGGVGEDGTELDRFKELRDGAFVDLAG
jgi:alkylation response protein AidB-like acyl-CoA dehydrogenase